MISARSLWLLHLWAAGAVLRSALTRTLAGAFSSTALAPLSASATLIAACRLVAAAVEGIDQVFVLECHPGEGRLQLQQEVQLEGMQLPSSLQADSAGRLWVAGMPGDMGAPAACLGRAKCSGVALQVSCLAWEHGGSPSGRLGQLPCL